MLIKPQKRKQQEKLNHNTMSKKQNVVQQPEPQKFEKPRNFKKIDFRNAGIADVQFSSGIVKLGGLYRVRLSWQKCLIAAALGLLLAVATLFFLKNTGLYSAGAIALCQGIARIVNTAMNIKGYEP